MSEQPGKTEEDLMRDSFERHMFNARFVAGTTRVGTGQFPFKVDCPSHQVLFARDEKGHYVDVYISAMWFAWKKALEHAWKPSWAFVEAALRKEYERQQYAYDMFPQVREEIAKSRQDLLKVIETVQFAKERNMPLPEVE